MSVKAFKWLFLGALAAFIFASNVAEFAPLGVSSVWSSRDGNRFAGGTQPWALVIAVAVIGLYVLLMCAEPAELGEPLPTVFRRFVAFCLDFVLATAAITPIIGIAPTIAEWRRTGIFQWSFERTTHAAGDGLLVTVGLLIGTSALILYYALPLVFRRPSPGTCILGYQVVSEEVSMSLRSAVLRTLLGFIALAGAYLAPLVGRDRKNGKFWLDKVFSTRALRLS